MVRIEAPFLVVGLTLFDAIQRSRSLVAPAHAQPNDPDSTSLLSTAYQALVHSTLLTWSSKSRMAPAVLVAFIQTVLNAMPSSSTPTGKSTNTKLFGEILLDLIWTVDAQLDEILSDVRLLLPVPGKEAERQGENPATFPPPKLTETRQNAEKDKIVLAELVQRLLVRSSICIFLPC